jgi:hypothetical protein
MKQPITEAISQSFFAIFSIFLSSGVAHHLCLALWWSLGGPTDVLKTRHARHIFPGYIFSDRPDIFPIIPDLSP